jgi:hypothetical protein
MRPLLWLVVVLLAGCESPPIEWRDPIAVSRVAPTARLIVDSAGSARYVTESARLAGVPRVRCVNSIAAAMGTSRAFAVWWEPRSDSSANLLFSSSTDSGKTWGPPLPVDTTDIGSNGCNRPPPALATVGDDMYVAYSMLAPEGKGVFFAHTMSSMLHSPVPVIYGERLVATAIAADANRVAVAYEEPNGSRERVDLALSVTQGHLFELHAVASRDVDVAALPSVAFSGSIVAVGWTERTAAGAATGTVVRVGRIK